MLKWERLTCWTRSLVVWRSLLFSTTSAASGFNDFRRKRRRFCRLFITTTTWSKAISARQRQRREGGDRSEIFFWASKWCVVCESVRSVVCCVLACVLSITLCCSIGVQRVHHSSKATEFVAEQRRTSTQTRRLSSGNLVLFYTPERVCDEGSGEARVGSHEGSLVCLWIWQV